MHESEEIVEKVEPIYLVAEGQPTLLVDGAAIQTHDTMTFLLLFKRETFYGNAEDPETTTKRQSFCQGRFAFTPRSFMAFAGLIEEHKAKMISQLTDAAEKVTSEPEAEQNG